jgi:hypothetical protein
MCRALPKRKHKTLITPTIKCSFLSLNRKSESKGPISDSGVTYYTNLYDPGSEANYFSPRRADVRNVRSYTSTEPYVFMVWCLIQNRDNFSFTFIN